MTAHLSKTAPLPKIQTLPCGRPLPKTMDQRADSIHLFQSAKEKLDEYISKKALKKSGVRDKILKTIIYEARHFTAQDLVHRLRQRYSEVGKATLYRTLPILIECGIIQEGPTDSQGQTLYELADHHHHDHIVCLDCQFIFEFHDKIIENQQEKVSEKAKFTAKSHRHVIYASCDYNKK